MAEDKVIAGGYTGKILFVNLSSGEIGQISLSDQLRNKFIGGSGVGAVLLTHFAKDCKDWRSEQNPLIFMTGPMANTVIPCSGRHQVMALSPHGILVESDAGGTWGLMLKRAGFDGIVITGKAKRPTYIWINEGQVEARSADQFWGLDTYETDEGIRAATHARAVVACIGPAGEKLARVAGIFHDGRDARPAARGGIGAVMGDKKLKAIAVYGTKQTAIARRRDLVEIIREENKRIREAALPMNLYGTAGGVVTAEKFGDLPIRNWAKGSWPEGAERISGKKMAETILTGTYACGACPIRCGRRVRIEEGPYAPVDGAGPEYETLAMLGSLCLVDDLEAIAKANELCNRYGIDTISTGAIIAFAMECVEHGLINEEDYPIQWGNPDSLLNLIHSIGRQEGIGILLGQGVRQAAAQIGGKAPEFAIESKGLELPGHDPRAFTSLAVGYATSNRGACHLQSLTYPFERSTPYPGLGYSEVPDRFAAAGKGEMTAKFQNLMSVFDSLKLCKFLLIGPQLPVTRTAEWLNYVTGWEFTAEDLLEAGERIFNLKRMFNVDRGISRKDDTLPARITSTPRREGGSPANLPPLGSMLREYYDYRGWDELGIPQPERLAALGIGREVIENLKREIQITGL